MARTDHQSVEQYIAAQPEAARPALEQVRAAIQAALPDGQEVISYQIPAWRVAGRVAVFFAGWKNHLSVYPASERIVQALGEKLAPYEVSKGTIRFPLDRPPPLELIAEIAKLMAEAARERTAARRGQAVRPPVTTSRAGPP